MRRHLKILCIVDHLGSGGAQRQMVELASGLASRGHEVHTFCLFSEHDFFRDRLLSAGVHVHTTSKGRGFSLRVLAELRRYVASGSFDVVVAFLEGPAAYAELVGLARPGVPIVVSERAGQEAPPTGVRPYVARLLHLRARMVVTNTRAHADWLQRHFPWLRGRVTCIYNGVGAQYFVEGWQAPAARDELRLLGVGRIAPQKNIDGLIRGLAMLQARYGRVPHVCWAGRVDDERYAASLERLLDEHPAVRLCWRWLGEAKDVAALLPQYHALVMPSRFEGLPNAVCEAFAAGLPVLASNVADHPVLIGDGQRGRLFDPVSTDEIARAIDELAAQSADRWRTMSRSAVRFARDVLDIDHMISAYESMLLGLARPGRLGSTPHEPARTAEPR